MNPYHHALSSVRRFGGRPEDYLGLHQWFDASKAFMPDIRHRALRHHAEGIFLAETVFGPVIENCAGRKIPTRFLAEQHVKEDLARIPTVQDWLVCLRPEAWMMRGSIRSASLDQEAAPTEAASASPTCGLAERSASSPCDDAALQGASRGPGTVAPFEKPDG